MSKKSNKTEHVLKLITKNQEVEEGGAEQRINYRKTQEIKDKHQDNGNDINECQSHQ